jgi:hypothetical protein
MPNYRRKSGAFLATSCDLKTKQKLIWIFCRSCFSTSSWQQSCALAFSRLKARRLLVKFCRSIGRDSQLSFSLSGTAKSGLLNLVNKRSKSLAGERPFLPTFCGCWEKVWSDGRDAVRKTQWIAVCEAHTLVRAAHNLSVRRP